MTYDIQNICYGQNAALERSNIGLEGFMVDSFLLTRKRVIEAAVVVS